MTTLTDLLAILSRPFRDQKDLEKMIADAHAWHIKFERALRAELDEWIPRFFQELEHNDYQRGRLDVIREMLGLKQTKGHDENDFKKLWKDETKGASSS